MKSIFNLEKESRYPKLDMDINNADIVIIGGGISGLLTAYYLTKENKKVILIEKDTILGGTTSRTTATITALQWAQYHTLAKKYSLDFAKLYFESQLEGIKKYQKIIDDENIDCDFSYQDAYLYTKTHNSEKLLKEFEILRKFNNSVSIEKKIDLPYEIKLALKLEKQAQFDVIKFLEQLPKNFTIYENTKIVDLNLNDKILTTDNFYKIQADKIIIATKYPITNHGAWYLKMYQIKSYVIGATYPPLKGFYVCVDKKGEYLRSYNSYLLLGGEDERTGGKSICDKYETLTTKLKTFCSTDVEYKYSAIDCITYDNIPFIGSLNEKKKDIYIITGFNEFGMANSIVGANLITDLICSKENKYQKIFSLQRPYLRHHLKEFINHGAISVVNLLKGLFFLPFPRNSLKTNTSKTIFYKGKFYLAYKDENNKIYYVKKNCTHLGCALQFNHSDKTFECPCHGSRFDLDGNIIDSPTKKEIAKE